MQFIQIASKQHEFPIKMTKEDRNIKEMFLKKNISIRSSNLSRLKYEVARRPDGKKTSL